MISWKPVCSYALMVLFLFPLVPAASAQTLLQITSPVQGTSFPLYTEGQTYAITLSADPSVSNIFVTPQSPLPAAQPTSNPLQFTLTLPTNIDPGIYSIGAVGFTSSGDVEAAPVLIDVERAGYPISLTVQPVALQLRGAGDQTPISVWGTYGDGTKLVLSNSTELSYQWSYQPTTVATATSQLAQTAQGTLPPIGPLTVTAVSVGSTVLVVTTGLNSPELCCMASAAIFVTVTPPPPTGPAPVITSVSTTTGTPGVTQVTVNGSNFGSTEGSGYVELGSMSATTISLWTSTQIVATVPLGSMSGVVEVGQNGLASNDIPFTTVVPSITGLSATSGTTGTPITISGANFGASQGSSSVIFNIAAATPSSWADGTIVAPVPAGATTGNVVVIVNGTPSNAVGFTATPTITSLQPPQGAIGAAVTINGSNFGNTQGASTVTFNGVLATASTWSSGMIGVTVPTGALTGPVVITVNGVTGNGMSFAVTTPLVLTSISPTALAPGMQVTFTGSGFGATQGSGSVGFNNTAGTVVSWSDTQVVATVAAGTNPGNAWVTQNGTRSNYVAFTMIPPTLTSISPTALAPGMQVTFTGSGFGATQGSGSVGFNNTAGTVVSWSDTQVVATVAAGTNPGNAWVTQNGTRSNYVTFTMIPPTLTSISPTALAPGMQVTFTGSGFGATQGSGSVGFNNTAGTVVSWSDTQVVATVAAGTNPGNAWVTQNGTRSNYVAFTMIPPTLTSISPTALAPGMQVTFTGSGFGATQGSGSVGFNNTAGTVVSWSDTQVVATVAAGTNPGNAWVTQNGTRSNYVAFTMIPPTLTSISPTALAPGMQVTFTGSGFGATQGSGSVGFNNTAGTVVSWSDTQVVATVAAGTNPGNAWVTQNGTRSNYVTFTILPG